VRLALCAVAVALAICAHLGAREAARLSEGQQLLAAAILAVDEDSIARDEWVADRHRVRCDWEIEWAQGSFELQRAVMACNQVRPCMVEWSVASRDMGGPPNAARW